MAPAVAEARGQQVGHEAHRQHALHDHIGKSELLRFFAVGVVILSRSRITLTHRQGNFLVYRCQGFQGRAGADRKAPSSLFLAVLVHHRPVSGTLADKALVRPPARIGLSPASISRWMLSSRGPIEAVPVLAVVGQDGRFGPGGGVPRPPQGGAEPGPDCGVVDVGRETLRRLPRPAVPVRPPSPQCLLGLKGRSVPSASRIRWFGTTPAVSSNQKAESWVRTAPL